MIDHKNLSRVLFGSSTRFCGPLEKFHSVVYEARDEDELQRDLPILEVVFNLKCRQLLFRSLERLLAFERVEDGGLDEYRRRFTKILGKRITLPDVERMVTGLSVDEFVNLL